jgi:hypothetical protein
MIKSAEVQAIKTWDTVNERNNKYEQSTKARWWSKYVKVTNTLPVNKCAFCLKNLYNTNR